MCFFTSAEESNLEQKEHSSTLKTVIHRKYSFETLTEFSLGNNVVDAEGSKIEGFL
jgi:hypothetical protein